MDAEQVKLSQHALQRYMERSGTKKRDRAEKKLRQMLAEGQRVEIAKKWKLATIMRHSFNDATYLNYHGWILVICDSVLVTVHPASANRWHKP